MNAHISMSCNHARILPSCQSKSFSHAVRFFAYCFFYFCFYFPHLKKGRNQNHA